VDGFAAVSVRKWALRNLEKLQKTLALFGTFDIILNWHILAPVKRIGAISPRGGER